MQLDYKIRSLKNQERYDQILVQESYQFSKRSEHGNIVKNREVEMLKIILSILN